MSIPTIKQILFTADGIKDKPMEHCYDCLANHQQSSCPGYGDYSAEAAQLVEILRRSKYESHGSLMSYIGQLSGGHLPNGERCPFCGEDEFDLIGLKKHLMASWCPLFDATESI